MILDIIITRLPQEGKFTIGKQYIMTNWKMKMSIFHVIFGEIADDEGKLCWVDYHDFKFVNKI